MSAIDKLPGAGIDGCSMLLYGMYSQQRFQLIYSLKSRCNTVILYIGLPTILSVALYSYILATESGNMCASLSTSLLLCISSIVIGFVVAVLQCISFARVVSKPCTGDDWPINFNRRTIRDTLLGILLSQLYLNAVHILYASTLYSTVSIAVSWSHCARSIATGTWFSIMTSYTIVTLGFILHYSKSIGCVPTLTRLYILECRLDSGRLLKPHL